MSARTGLDVIEPGDPRYPAARHVYSGTGAPAAVVRVRTEAQVPDALDLARRRKDADGSAISVRSGGHGISSLATNDGGTVIDLSGLSTVSMLGGRRVRIGAGARWGAVARALAPHGLAISSGDSGDVGVGGLATAGGIGLLGRAHGLTIDSLVAADVVTADGRRRRVDAADEPDLFWAIRGAGANVGIVVAFEFEAAATPLVARASLAYRIEDTAGFLERWGRTVQDAPRAVSAFLYLGGGYAQATVVVADGDRDAASAALAPFGALPGLAGGRAELVPYADVPLTTGATHSGQQPARTRNGLAERLDHDLSRRITELAGTIEMVQIRSVGGAINDVAPQATAYAHRHQNFCVTAVGTATRDRFDARWAPVREHLDGLYLSFQSDHTAADLAAAFPEPTLSRLRAIKATVDPDDVFDQNFDVAATAPAGGASRPA